MNGKRHYTITELNRNGNANLKENGNANLTENGNANLTEKGNANLTENVNSNLTENGITMTTLIPTCMKNAFEALHDAPILRKYQPTTSWMTTIKMIRKPWKKQ